MQGQGRARAAIDFINQIKSNLGLTLVIPVSRADSRREYSQIDLTAENLRFVRICQMGLVFGDDNLLFNPDDPSQFRLDANTGRSGHLQNLTRHREIFVKRKV